MSANIFCLIQNLTKAQAELFSSRSNYTAKSDFNQEKAGERILRLDFV